jgi:hypothetical protein
LEGSEIADSGIGIKGRRKRGPKLVLVLVTISLAAIMIISGLMLTGRSVNDQLEFKSGDYFYYEITGKQNSTTVEGNETIDLAEGFTISSRMGYALPQMESGKFNKYSQIGVWVGDHRIDTKWGEKTAQMFLKIADMKTIVITDVGIDSSIIYRTTYLTSDSAVRSVLMASNNSDIPNADTRISGDVAIGLGKVQNYSGTLRMFLPTEGVYMYGSVAVLEGQGLTYNMTDSGAYLYFFSVQDLNDISNDGQLHFQKSVSLELNQTGMVSSKVPAGTYWFCLIIESASGGSFWPYWTTETSS